jgi:two-component system cell cycle sensor histidine kinase/response regulator CckA
MRILVADDEAGIRELVATVLRQAGHTVVSAGSVDEAVRAMATVDGAVVDASLAGADGVALARRLEDAGVPRRRIVMMSGLGPPPSVPYRWLTKPFRLDMLREAVSAWTAH